MEIITIIVLYCVFIYSGMLYILFRSDQGIRFQFIFNITGRDYGIIKLIVGCLSLFVWLNEWGFILSLPFIVYPLIIWKRGGYIAGYLGKGWKDFY